MATWRKVMISQGNADKLDPRVKNGVVETDSYRCGECQGSETECQLQKNIAAQ